MGEIATKQRTIDVRRGQFVLGFAYATMIAVAAWPIRHVRPGVGGDWDWIAGISYVAEHGLRYGEQIVWSYGPLGFLTTPYGPVLYYGDIFVLSWLFLAVVQLLLASTLLAALRRSYSLAVAIVVAFAVTALTADRALTLGVAWCALALTRDETAPRGPCDFAFPPALGALTAVALLGKLNQGVVLVVLAGATLLTVPTRSRRLDVASFMGALVASAALGWFISGQTLADAWPYFHNGAELIGGYAAAMGLTDPAHRWTHAAALAIAALALAVAWSTVQHAGPRRRLGVLGLTAIYTFFNFKEGFVRQSTEHLDWYFGDMLVLFAVLPTRRLWRLVELGSALGLVVAIVALLGLHKVVPMLNPYANVKAAADQVRTVASPARQDALMAGLRQEIASTYGVGSSLLDRIGRRTTMLWPYLFGEVAYAYDLNFRPLPGFEPYATYTPTLDLLGASMLSSPLAPERILRALIDGIDKRYPTFEAPLATLAIFCRYRQLVQRPPWQLLARARDRCGKQRVMKTLRAPWGAPVDVPRSVRAHAFVLVRIEGANPQGLERAQELLLRPARRWVVLDGTRFPLVAATASDGLLVRAPRELDYPPPFEVAPDPSQIAVSRAGSEPRGRLRYTFVELAAQPFRSRAR